MKNQARFLSTYRLQIRKTFPFKKAAAVAGYLNELGISHLYLSPIFESMPDSNHGYDSIDPTRISQERGGEKGFAQLMAQVGRNQNLRGAILDIVPNHLAASVLNPAWYDVLRLGKASKYFNFFDIRARASGDFRVVLPVLGKPLKSVLAAKELQITIRSGEPVVKYWDKYFPLTPTSHAEVMDLAGKGKKALSHLSLKTIDAILSQQHYVLEDWRTGSQKINYRRFFDINDLAAVRVEDPKAFAWSHSKVKELLATYPQIQGLRVDHVDGLTDPEAYLQNLKKISPHIWVEKILGDGETLPTTWPVNGTTGYEFSNSNARLFVDLPGLLHLHAHYTKHVDRRWERFGECVYDSKREILESHFISEIEYLTNELYRLAARARSQADFSKEELHLVLTELTSSLRVYRTYAKLGEPINSRWLQNGLAEAEGRGLITTPNAFAWLRSVLLAPGDWEPELFQAIKRWEQLSGPVMAKGLEDTALYRYFPHLSLNGVGGEPDWTGDGAIEFHAANREKLRSQPLTMNASSTHDTKRSEDVRSRLHVVSELAEDWSALFNRWHQPEGSIDSSTQYLVYETLVGSWPLDDKVTAEFKERMQNYFLKAVREAKSATNWSHPDQAYESRLAKFVDEVLESKTSQARRLRDQLETFAHKCAYFGAFNSLSSLVLKAFSPGVPDFYQGCELWDSSLVDPDNRRPVDFDLRSKLLKNMKAQNAKSPKTLRNRLVSKWRSGEIKLWLTHQCLKARQQYPDLFLKGEYYAVDPIGNRRRHFISFVRHFEGQWALIVVPRFLAGRLRMTEALTLADTQINSVRFEMPAAAPTSWTNPLSGNVLNGRSFSAGEVMEGWPVGVLFSNSAPD